MEDGSIQDTSNRFANCLIIFKFAHYLYNIFTLDKIPVPSYLFLGDEIINLEFMQLPVATYPVSGADMKTLG